MWATAPQPRPKNIRQDTVCLNLDADPQASCGFVCHLFCQNYNWVLCGVPLTAPQDNCLDLASLVIGTLGFLGSRRLRWGAASHQQRPSSTADWKLKHFRIKRVNRGTTADTKTKALVSSPACILGITEVSNWLH